MSRRIKNKRRRQQTCNLPQICFTLPTLRMIKDALTIMEQTILLATQPLPNLDFAIETLGILKIKLEEMLQREEWDKKILLDYNEIHLLYASLHMHLLNLTRQQDHKLMEQCGTLCKRFASLVKYAEQSKKIRR